MTHWLKIIDKTLTETPAMAWLQGDKKQHVIRTINDDYNFGMLSIDFITDMRRIPVAQRDAELVLNIANQIAEKAPIAAHPEKVVFFSGASQKEAEAFVNDKTDHNVIHTTLPGAVLEMLMLFDGDLKLTDEQRYQPWNTLSARLAHCVEGNTTALLKQPKPKATFINYEMPTFLLENKKLLTLNNVDKWEFWNNLEILNLSVEHSVEHKNQIIQTHTQRLTLTN